MKHKKGDGEINFVIWIAVFLAILSVFNSILGDTLVTESTPSHDNWLEDLLDAILSFFTDMTENIPVIGDFFSLLFTVITFSNIHEHLETILIAIVTIPLGYVAFRALRGGG